MEESKKGKRTPKKVSKIKTFTIPYSEKEIKENINRIYGYSKDEIIYKAFKFHSQGNIKESERYYRYFINQGFIDNRVFSNYGVVLKTLGKLQEAELYTLKAIQLDPYFAEAHLNLGNILKEKGKYQEAALSISKAIRINPSFTNAHYNLGIIMKDLGKLKEAEVSTRKAIELNPNLADAHLNLGCILIAQGEPKKAELSTLRAIELKPNFANNYSNLGYILKYLGKLQEAELSTRKAIELNPNLADAYLILGTILIEQGELKRGEESTRKAINLKPDHANAHFNLGKILRDKGQYESAISSYKEALKYSYEKDFIIAEILKLLSLMSDWDSASEYIPFLDKLGINQSSIDPYKILHLEDNPKYEFEVAKNFFNRNHKKISKPIKLIRRKKINIGYFSADFKTHPVMLLLIRILELHDSSKFNVYLYSLTPIEDKYTQRGKEAAFGFRSIHHLNDLEIVELARKDQLDIAIDLMGYTHNSRMNIFSYRVAPIQINYLGFPCTSGSKEMDYIIADKNIIPKKYKHFYTEKILYMPNCYIPYDNTRRIADNQYKRSDFKLDDQSFVLAAFHSNYKITPKEIKIWSNLLSKIPKSILWISELKSPACLNLIKCFKNQGVDTKRIVFAKKLPSIEDHLARHSCADIFIDTFNYNGHSTSIDSLWAGLPVVTMMGESFSARVTGSILTSINLKELISYNTSQYEEIIISLSKNPAKLKSVREKLVEARNNSSLFDSKKQTTDLENLYSCLMNKQK